LGWLLHRVVLRLVTIFRPDEEKSSWLVSSLAGLLSRKQIPLERTGGPNRNSEPETRPSGAWTGHPLSEHERLEIFSTLRQQLLGIADRMLGSASDAEDMLRETFIRWQQSSQVPIESPEAFLVTIITRLCLNYLQSARVKREQYFGQIRNIYIVSNPGKLTALAATVVGRLTTCGFS
jgi:Sigma-70 region 2